MSRELELYVYNSEKGYREDVKVPVATEKELLDFANEVRKAGGAEAIPALLPSVPSEPESCLIANALNFGCEVDGSNFPSSQPGFNLWKMSFIGADYDTSMETALKVGKALDLKVVGEEDGEDWPAVLLPEHIGNAALAFDQRKAFSEYVKPEYQ